MRFSFKKVYTEDELNRKLEKLNGAIRSGNLKMLRDRISKTPSASFLMKDAEGNTVFHNAIRHGNEAILKIMLKALPNESFNSLNDIGVTPLQYAKVLEKENFAEHIELELLMRNDESIILGNRVVESRFERIKPQEVQSVPNTNSVEYFPQPSAPVLHNYDRNLASDNRRFQFDGYYYHLVTHSNSAPNAPSGSRISKPNSLYPEIYRHPTEPQYQRMAPDIRNNTNNNYSQEYPGAAYF